MSGSGWLTAIEASPILGVTPGQVAWLAKRGLVVSKKSVDGRWLIEETSARARVAEEARWVSWARAAAIVGCTETTIHQAARRGEFVRRRVNRGTPSLERTSVEEFGRRWRTERATAEERRLQRPAKRAASNQPAAVEGDIWLDSATTALILAVSSTRVSQLARAERLPCTMCGGRRWFRRSHVEQIAAARAHGTLSPRALVALPSGERHRRGEPSAVF